MGRRKPSLQALSLFTGAGGMDVGIANAGFENVWANDFDPKACETYELNHSNPIKCGDIRDFAGDLANHAEIDLVHGGPPCQGFSVAGKMDPSDPRSELVWEFVEAVKIIRPRAFVCENVAALGKLEKWRPIRSEIIKRLSKVGYQTEFIVLTASEYGVPQKRQRVFFIGSREIDAPFDLRALFSKVQETAPTVREVFKDLGRPGSERNQGLCNAKITIAQSPVMRKSPYAGMLFNGLGRPLNPDDFASTMHASMGGNKTPFVDEEQLYNDGPSWVEEYHKSLTDGGDPLPLDAAPSRLRRITISEARAIQTFPEEYQFAGRPSAQFRQIGNAVPCKLAEAVGKVAIRVLKRKLPERMAEESGQLQLI